MFFLKKICYKTALLARGNKLFSGSRCALTQNAPSSGKSLPAQPFQMFFSGILLAALLDFTACI